jgi:hypothetical protein
LRQTTAAGIALLMLMLTGAHAATPKSPPPPLPAECPADPFCPASACQTSLTAAASTLAPTFPCPRNGSNQDDVDIFAWNAFITWNWPASKSCKPDKSRSILEVKGGATGPVVWQTQMATDDLFVAPGQKPAEWCSAPTIFNNVPRTFRHIAKADAAAHLLGGAFAHVAEPGGDQAPASGVVTDPNGRWLRYEKLVNDVEASYIKERNLWSKAGLGDQAILLPILSTEFEASWKVLTRSEIASHRYYTTLATLFNNPEGSQPSPEKKPVTLGLVGLHIAHKGPNGVFWSTFEQIDNEKVFFNPKSSVAPNTQTAKDPYLELDPKSRKPTTPGVNIKRLTPIASSDAINRYYQSLLAGSVFANYRLVSTQWPGGVPRQVANITMETYVQQLTAGDPRFPGQKLTGCVACHARSKWDQTFVFLEAK